MSDYYGAEDGRQVWHQPLPLNLPLHALLSIKVPMTEAEWQRLWELLDAMKPGLVEAGEER